VHDRLLPAAEELGRTNATELSRAHDEAREASSQRQAAVWVVGASLLGLLLAAQVVLAHRVRRILNPALLAATLLTVAVVGGLSLVLRDSAEDLRAADEDAFASVLALSQARAVAYDANGDKSRGLLDPAQAADHEAAFLDRTRQLVGLPEVTLDTFDDRFRRARVQVADGQDPPFTGHLGTALANITFDGELDLALESLTLYAEYQVDDRRMRELVAGGDQAEAVRFTLSYQDDGSNGSFARFDQALTEFRDLNQDRFELFVARGSDRLAWWAVGALVTAALIVALCALGLWWRLAEYRA
jgi:hypothetical protein